MRVQGELGTDGWEVLSLRARSITGSREVAAVLRVAVAFDRGDEAVGVDQAQDE